MKYTGSYDDLKALILTGGFKGDWSHEGDKMVFRSHGGAVLNWWPKTKKKTLHVQGDSSDATRMESLFGDESASPVGTSASAAATLKKPVASNNAKVFVVHGHDTEARDQLELVLHRLNLNPFILQNRSAGGLTIIEALEKEILADAPLFGIVLMTPDDMGYGKAEGSSEVQPRARQNVVLEMGMLIARLGRPRVAILKKGHVDLPSDTNGIIYLPFNDHVRETVTKLAGRLQEAGFTLDVNDIASAGS